MKTKNIKQTVTFNASPIDIYNLLMDSNKHAAFTGDVDKLSTKIKGEFSVFGGYCHGYNIELIPGSKIAQAWHFAEDGWPDEHYSICTFKFEPVGDKTKLVFTQTDIPEHKVESLKSGWKEFYWEAIKSYTKNN